MNNFSNILLSVALISGSPVIASKSHTDSQPKETQGRIKTSSSEIHRICGQNFGGEIIPVSCENIASILEQNPGFKADTRVKLDNGGTLHTLRDKEGYIILQVISSPEKKK